MPIKVQAVSDIGCLRSNNEDHILVVDEVFTDGSRVVEFTDAKKLIFAVADGMGGHNAGEVASGMVLQSLAEFFQRLDPEIIFNDFESSLKMWLEDIHAELINAGNKNSSYKGMGTTLSGIFVGNAGIYAFNAGDSRTYYYLDGLLRQISKDHTWAEASGIPGMKTNLLVNCIGAIKESYIDVFDLTNLSTNGINFLICSDGLSDLVSNSAISKFLNPMQIDRLVNEANRLGGRDNISIIGLELG